MSAPHPVQPHQAPEQPPVYASDQSSNPEFPHPGQQQEQPGRPSTASFPSPEQNMPFQYNAFLHALDTSTPQVPPSVESAHVPTPVGTGLRLQTDHIAEMNRQNFAANARAVLAETPPQTVFNAGLPVRSSSIRSIHASRTHRAESLSTSSAMSSPGVGPLVDMSPLPSPISGWGSPDFGRKSTDEMDEPRSEPHSLAQTPTSTPDSIGAERTSPKKRKIPFIAAAANGQQAQIYNANSAAHARNRSLSDYIPDGMQVPKLRNIVVSSSGAPYMSQQTFSPSEDHMHREAHLAVQRGLAIPRPPTPPDSNRGRKSDELESLSTSPSPSLGPLPTYYEAKSFPNGKPKKWRSIRQLGQGQFSTVMLATSEMPTTGTQPGSSEAETNLNPKSLVAVKICEHGPAGGADENKIEQSIKRELDILKSISHPSCVHLKAVSILDRQTLLFLNYCPGGDLYDLAKTKLELLTPSLIRRIFAELVFAVQYLHRQYIVHRDIKLENILVNLTAAAISTITDWQTYPSPVITLTDLGLGRYIPKPPESPLLNRRCGSEDYAAPEVLIGQEYDGRSTDAWALGVTLYILMEGRMPFDPIPGSRRKSPTSHKIARCEWQWVKWTDEKGEWDPKKGSALNGAREIVEGLLARTRTRWALEKVEKTEWVNGGVQVEGGLKRIDEDDSEA